MLITHNFHFSSKAANFNFTSSSSLRSERALRYIREKLIISSRESRTWIGRKRFSFCFIFVREISRARYAWIYGELEHRDSTFSREFTHWLLRDGEMMCVRDEANSHSWIWYFQISHGFQFLLSREEEKVSRVSLESIKIHISSRSSTMRRIFTQHISRTRRWWAAEISWQVFVLASGSRRRIFSEFKFEFPAPPSKKGLMRQWCVARPATYTQSRTLSDKKDLL